MKYSIFALAGVGLFLAAGSASANEVTLAGLFDGDRQALEHNCADAKATSGNDFEIITQCGPGNR
jgi:hypothetical protein